MSKAKDRSAVEQIEWMRNLLALVLVGAFVAIIGGLLFKTIPEGNNDVITYMLGQLSGMALTALGFYFVNKAGQDAVDEKRADNTKAAFDAIKAASTTTDGTDTGALKPGDTVTLDKPTPAKDGEM